MFPVLLCFAIADNALHLALNGGSTTLTIDIGTHTIRTQVNTVKATTIQIRVHLFLMGC